MELSAGFSPAWIRLEGGCLIYSSHESFEKWRASPVLPRPAEFWRLCCAAGALRMRSNGSRGWICTNSNRVRASHAPVTSRGRIQKMADPNPDSESGLISPADNPESFRGSLSYESFEDGGDRRVTLPFSPACKA